MVCWMKYHHGVYYSGTTIYVHSYDLFLNYGFEKKEKCDVPLCRVPDELLVQTHWCKWSHNPEEEINKVTQ